ncbi:MAG: hypothetical protein WDA75_19095 [Candidatus Latescibacterota bacterium]|jgi:hypothetical protein
MAHTWITNLRHFMDDDGEIPEALPGSALRLVRFLGAIVQWVTIHTPAEYPWTNVPCRRNPGHRPCPGDIHAQFDAEETTILWECPFCGANGTIRGWEGTCWDRTDERPPP